MFPGLNIKEQLKKLVPESFVNRYTITGMIFFIWMFFFDKNKWLNQWQLSQSIYRLEKEKKNLAEMIIDAKKDKLDLDQNKEKYAREKYFMHKPNEDVYIFEESFKQKQ
ncbi:MAG: septum formation initiator family protein [Saprospiraceae bacterium]